MKIYQVIRAMLLSRMFVAFSGLAFLAAADDGVAASNQIAEVLLTTRGSEIHGIANVDQDTVRGQIIDNGADFTFAGQIINGRLSFQLSGRFVPACMAPRQQVSGEAEIVRGTAYTSVLVNCGNYFGGDWPVTVSITLPAASEGSAESPSTSNIPTPTASKTSADPVVATVQSSLTTLGFNPGQVDGNLNLATVQAIRQYERTIGLPEDGQITSQLLASLQTALALGRRAPAETSVTPKISATGTGFYISNEGVLITNYHVVEGCSKLAVSEGGALLLAIDAENDLALLKTPLHQGEVAKLRDKPSVRAGEEVVVVGFPLLGILAPQANVTTGVVSSLAGIRNDARFLQISAPVQPGNSGGPLLDMSGNVIGLVSAKLDAAKVADITGDLPENVNFAINAAVMRSLLESQSVPYSTGALTARRSTADVGDIGKSISDLVACWK